MQYSVVGKIKMLSLVVVTYVITGFGPSAFAQTCKPLDAATLSSTTTYVAKRYHIQNPSTLSLSGYAKVGDSCLWALHFQEAAQKRDMLLYLSPDHKYLFPTLYDLQDDPLVEEQAAAKATLKVLEAGEPPMRGASNAKVTIVEFSDFECPFCKRMQEMLEREMKQDSSVALVFRNNPLSMHPWAKVAAQIAECVQLQSPADFWKVHDFFFGNQQSITAVNASAVATQFIVANTGVDKKIFQSCVSKDLAVGPVTQDLDLGQKYGVRGTPTLFINGFRAPAISDQTQLHLLIEAIGRGESPLGLGLPPTGSGPIGSNANGQCAPTNRTGVGNDQIK